MAPAGPATMTMATSPATSASRSLLIELPSNRARRDGAAPAHEPRCPVPPARAVAGVCAYPAGCVDSGRQDLSVCPGQLPTAAGPDAGGLDDGVGPRGPPLAWHLSPDKRTTYRASCLMRR